MAPARPRHARRGLSPDEPALGEEEHRLRDPALDRIVYHAVGEAESRSWSIIRLEEPFPEARVTVRARTAPDRPTLLDRLSRSDDLDTAWFLPEDGVPARSEARRARLLSWDGTEATVAHDGPCDFVLARTFDPGWLAQVDDGPERPVLRADAGFQAVRLEGSGTRRVRLRYRVPRLTMWVTLSVGSLIVHLVCALIVIRPAPLRRP